MPAAYEYKSVMRRFSLPVNYESAGDFLAPYADEGWELITALSGQFIRTDDVYEIFYLRRKAV